MGGTSGALRAAGIDLGVDGNYTNPQAGMRTTDGTDCLLRDATTGEKSLAQIWDRIAPHRMTDHTDYEQTVGGKVTLQDVLDAIANGVDGSPVSIGTNFDTHGNFNLDGHIRDTWIHQARPTSYRRVQKQFGDYSTIQQALDSIPTQDSGLEGAPSADNWWLIEVAPGVYNENLNLNRSYVVIRGMSRDAVVIKSDSSGTSPEDWPMHIQADHVRVENLTVWNTRSVYASPAVMIGQKPSTGRADVTFTRVVALSGCADTVVIAPNCTGIVFNECKFGDQYDTVSTYSPATFNACEWYGGSTGQAAVWCNGAVGVRLNACRIAGSYGHLFSLTSSRVYANDCVNDCASADLYRAFDTTSIVYVKGGEFREPDPQYPIGNAAEVRAYDGGPVASYGYVRTDLGRPIGTRTGFASGYGTNGRYAMAYGAKLSGYDHTFARRASCSGVSGSTPYASGFVVDIDNDVRDCSGGNDTTGNLRLSYHSALSTATGVSLSEYDEDTATEKTTL